MVYLQHQSNISIPSLTQAKAELEMLNTEQGVGNEATTFYTFGRKAA